MMLGIAISQKQNSIAKIPNGPKLTITHAIYKFIIIINERIGFMWKCMPKIER